MAKKKSFWQKLNKPFFCQAPMAGITDAAFRQILVKYGKPAVLWTEMVSCEAIWAGKKDEYLLDLLYKNNQRPIVAQLFGARPEQFKKAVNLAKKLGFDGVDINLACPDKNVVKQGAGAALIKNPKLAVKIIQAAKKGAGKMPVSVKTRIGYSRNELDKWLPALLETDPAAITIHGRYKTQGFRGKADWQAIAQAIRFRNRFGSKTLIIGNGDVKNLAQAKERAKQTGVDGVMIGRAMLGNPWVFSDKKEITKKDKLKAIIEHTKYFEEIFKNKKSLDHLKKHLAAYARGFAGARELRVKLVRAKSAKEVYDIVLTAVNFRE